MGSVLRTLWYFVTGASRLETHKRRQTILALLRQSGSLDVDEVAARLDVSPNTIRNDFNALAADGQLRRVRGGATLLEYSSSDLDPTNRAFLDRWLANRKAKIQIARWAADLVEDGDSILLDASTTVFHMARFLQERRGLSVVTNGVEVGRALAANPSNTVLLLGGVLRSDGMLVTGLYNDHLLQDFHIKLAFVSCAGFTPEAGLTESDIRVAQLKSEMIAAASTVIALIDSSKFGKAYLAPFARTDQVARIFSDSGLAPGWIAQLQQTCAGLTVCDENSVAAFTPCAQEARHHVIGFANLSEQVPFAVEVRRSLERAAKEAGNIDLILADNQLDGDVALAVADRLIAAQPDLVIEYQIEERQNAVLMEKFRRANIPVIAVDIPMIGATYFGADNYRAGHMAGVALGQWIKEHWDGALDWLIAMEEPRAGAVPASRIQGQLDGLEEIIGRQEPETIARLNCGNTSEVSEAVMAAALVAHPHARRIAVISFNDDSALGALSAARRLGRDQDVIMTGQGADRSLREELNKPRSRIIGSTTFHPEQYGGQLIPLALKILRGEPVPPALHIEHTFIPAAHNLLANPLSGDA